MLSKNKRLNLSKKENKDFFAKALRIYRENFTIFYRDRHDAIKTTVVIPKKTNKKAVGRNFLKRRYYNFIEGVLSEINKLNQLDIVVVHKKNNQDLEKIKKELQKTLQYIAGSK